jgi:hypothetical protein
VLACLALAAPAAGAAEGGTGPTLAEAGAGSPPPPGGTTTTPAEGTKAPPFKCTVALQSNRVALARSAGGKKQTGTVMLTMKCNQATTANVTGFLTVTARARLGLGLTKTYEVGPLMKAVPLEAATPLTVKLPAAVIKALKARARVSANFTLVAGYSAHSTVAATSANALRLAAGARSGHHASARR